MADLILFKEPQLKDLKEEVITRVDSVYRQAVTKKVQDILRHSTSFQMATLVILCLSFMCASMFMFVFFLIATISDEHLWHLHGEVLRRLVAPAQPSISHEGKGPWICI